MPAIDPVSVPSLQTGSTRPATERVQQLNGEVFLKLLVTQLSNQDPSTPLNTNEMIAQTTQLASMEQLTALASTTSESFALSMRQSAADLLGRDVSYVDADGATRTAGVTSISFAGSMPVLHLGDTAVRLDAVAGLSLRP